MGQSRMDNPQKLVT